MPDDVQDPDDEWLLRPVAPKEVRIVVDLGEGAGVSSELRDALDTLVNELHASEVAGFAEPAPCPDLAECGGYKCRLGRCLPQYRFPCAWKEMCTVADFA